MKTFTQFLDSKEINEALRPEDQQYAQQFLMSKPTGTEETMQDIIRKSAIKGKIWIMVNDNGMTPEDKLRLSAFRVIADKIGYEIGQWNINITAGTGCAQAPIRAKPNLNKT